MELQLALTEFFEPGLVRYAYCLHHEAEAHPTAWLYSPRRLVLRGLAPGNYEVEIRAETAAGQAAANHLRVPLHVDARWWQWPLLWAFVAGLLIALGYAAYWLRLRREQREAARRTELAANLHDEVGALLTQISMQTDLLGAGVHAPDQQQAQLREVAATSRLAATQLQDVVWSFDARNDAVGSLLDRLRDHAYEVLQYGEVTITFEADPALETRLLPVETRRTLYLIFKEALTNSRKHAPQATHIQVALRAHARASGHGRRNMQARAEAVGGTCRTGFGAVPGQPGFGVLVEVPAGQ